MTVSDKSGRDLWSSSSRGSDRMVRRSETSAGESRGLLRFEPRDGPATFDGPAAFDGPARPGAHDAASAPPGLATFWPSRCRSCEVRWASMSSSNSCAPARLPSSGALYAYDQGGNHDSSY
jgi:hypothetical protein